MLSVPLLLAHSAEAVWRRKLPDLSEEGIMQLDRGTGSAWGTNGLGGWKRKTGTGSRGQIDGE